MKEDQAGRLISGYFDDTLSDQEVAELDALLLADAAHVLLFSRLAILHSAICEAVKIERSELEDMPGATQSGAGSDPGSTLLGLATTPPKDGSDDATSAGIDAPPMTLKQPLVAQARRSIRPTRLAAAILLVAGVALITILHQMGILGGNRPQPLAMGPSLDAIWSDPASVAAPGGLVKTGVPQSLASGYAELTSANGLVVIIQGPATFTVEKAGVVSVTSGKLTASVPKPARGFTVNTPVASIVDLGTEFGVSVSPTGQTDVQTFRGTVSLSSTVSSAASSASLITAGLARHVDSSGAISEIPADSTAFVRPRQFDDWNANGTPYQHWNAYSQRLGSDPDLVAYYTFDKSEAAPELLLNRASTTGAALDGELRGNDRLHERPLWTEGRWPQRGALAFARDSHEFVAVKAPAGSVLDFSRGKQTAAPFTICAWFRVEDPHPQHSSIFLRSTAGKGNTQQFAAELYPDSSIRASVGDVVAASPQAIANGQWQQIALVYDPDHGALKLYLDGNLVTQRNDAPRQLPESSLPLGLGCRTGPFLPPLCGRIDEFAVFRRVLTAQEVRAMYLAEKPD